MKFPAAHCFIALAPLALGACVPSFNPTARSASLPANGTGDFVWIRADGQRMTNNPALQSQFFVDQQACLDKSVQPAVAVSQDCMRARGYVYGPRPTT